MNDPRRELDVITADIDRLEGPAGTGVITQRVPSHINQGKARALDPVRDASAIAAWRAATGNTQPLSALQMREGARDATRGAIFDAQHRVRVAEHREAVAAAQAAYEAAAPVVAQLLPLLRELRATRRAAEGLRSAGQAHAAARAHDFTPLPIAQGLLFEGERVALAL